MQTPFSVNEAVAAAALCEMAARRGLHAARHEAEQTWRTVNATEDSERFVASWSWLFRGHSIERVPLHMVHNAQLPAWALVGNSIGIVNRLATDEQPMELLWIGPEPEGTPQIQELYVPVPPVMEEAPMVPPKKLGPATEAIIAAVRNHVPLFTRVAVASVLINVLSIVSSLFAMQVYDRVVPNFAYSTLWVLASGVLLAGLMELGLKLIRLKMLEESVLRLDEALSLYFYEKVMALKLDRRPNRVGSLVAQIRDYESVKGFFTSTTLFAIADLPFIFLFIGVIAMIGGPITWALVLFLPISLAIGLVMYKPISRAQKADSDEAARKTGILFETVAGAEGIKSLGGEPRFSDVWLRSTRAAARQGSELRNLNSYAQFALALVQQMAYVAVVIIGVYAIKDGKVTMGGLIACSMLGGRVLGNIAQIAQLLLQWHNASYSLEILNNLLSRPSDDTPDREASTRSAPLDYTFNNVKYAYEGSQVAQLVVPSLTIRAGERVAVVGANGSGKSTLVKLMAGIGTPLEGQVRLAGLDLQQCRPSWLRETIGYLPQEVRLYSGTLAENLALGISMPSEAELLDAAERSGLLPTIQRHPLGLNLPIREGGMGLSGGQRQMVGLARLLLQKPRIWLLDEPSASLDQEGENRLVRVLQNLPADNTVVFISHKNSWLALVSRVIALEAGQIKVDMTGEQLRLVAQQQAAAAQGALQNNNGGAASAPGATSA